VYSLYSPRYGVSVTDWYTLCTVDIATYYIIFNRERDRVYLTTVNSKAGML